MAGSTQGPMEASTARSTRHAALGALVAFFVVWSFRATVFYFVDESIAADLWRSIYSTSVKFALWVLPAIAFARFVREQPPVAYLGITTMPSGRAWGVSALLTALYLGAVIALEVAIGGKAFVPVLPGMAALVFLIASCLIEEILFRGLILRELSECFRGAAANVVCSLLFVAIHLPYWLWSRGLDAGVMADAVGVFLVSLLFGVLYLRTRSIWPAFAAHVLNNSVSGFLVAGHGG